MKYRYWNYQMLQTMFNEIDVFGICVFLGSRHQCGSAK